VSEMECIGDDGIDNDGRPYRTTPRTYGGMIHALKCHHPENEQGMDDRLPLIFCVKIQESAEYLEMVHEKLVQWGRVVVVLLQLEFEGDHGNGSKSLAVIVTTTVEGKYPLLQFDVDDVLIPVLQIASMRYRTSLTKAKQSLNRR